VICVSPEILIKGFLIERKLGGRVAYLNFEGFTILIIDEKGD
jgi:hypothetical protein